MPRYRVAAVVLAVCALCSVFIAAHHPHNLHDARLDEATHGALIVSGVAIECVLILYALRPMANRTINVVAIVLSALGMLGIVLAGCTDGFFVPWFQSYVSSGSVDARSAHAVFAAAWIAIQILSKLSFIAIGCAGILWCMEMLREPRFRIAGAIGTLSALGLVLFAAIGGPLRPHNLVVAGIALSVWCCALAYRIAAQPAA
ncbi:MAG: hypothetical protein JOZ77_03380 [Candidatus Eremiobacteraeota bacterium]|nr:hypothetical protein [Candidatus Eremiobacteraeota bacterium]